MNAEETKARLAAIEIELKGNAADYQILGFMSCGTNPELAAIRAKQELLWAEKARLSPNFRHVPDVRHQPVAYAAR